MPELNKNDLVGPNPEKKQPRSMQKIFLAVFLIMVISLASVYLWRTGGSSIIKTFLAKNNANKTSPPEGDKALFSLNLTKPVFAQAEETSASVIPAIPVYEIKASQLENLGSFKKENINFSQSELAALEKPSFFLTENNLIKEQSNSGLDDFADTYRSFMGNTDEHYREPQNSLFITSDFGLHLYHLLVDRSFQAIEEAKFQPKLREMTKTLFIDSINNYNNSSDVKLKQSYKELSIFYLIPLVVLDAGLSATAQLKPEDFPDYAQYIQALDQAQINQSQQKLSFSLTGKSYNGLNLPDDIFITAKAELELISAAKGIASSPFFTPLRSEFKNDYSQFVPRSHYTKNNILKSYFIAMMWFGRMGFTIKDTALTRDALLITGQINNLTVGSSSLARMWSDLSATIDFFVGETDDLTASQYTAEAKKVFGGSISYANLVNDDQLQRFIAAAKQDLPKPKILSEAIMMNAVDEKTKEELLADTMQFRFMGQRFTPDAYFLNRLTQGDEAPDPETGQKLPSMPTALMPLSLIAPENKTVKPYLDNWVTEQAPQSDKIIAKVYGQLKAEISAYTEATWTQNIYWSWLNCFRSLLADYGLGYPLFMTGPDWQKKNLGTTLGSYTELKHDTLLYAKQSYAELGGGGAEEPPLPPVVKGYIEPDLVFWNRLINLAKTTKNGLIARELLPEEFITRYDTFIKAGEFFQKIITQELANQAISTADFEKLRTVPSALSQIAQPLAGQELTDKDRRAGIIADIHTDAVHNQILYEATAKPYIIYVAVKDTNGTRLTRGAVYSHYEFANPIDGRLADEDWQKKVYEGSGALPEADQWTKDLVK